jgi:hypothetical protein
MASSVALMGVGMPAQLAARLGMDPSNLTTTGTTQATAAKALTKNVKLVTAGSQTGSIIPSTAEVGDVYYFFNSTATTGIVYSPTGSTLNGAASTTGQNVAQNKMCIMYQYAQGAWASLVAA